MVDSVIHWTTALIFSVLAVSLWPERRARETDATVTARRIRPRTRQEFLRAA
jgi:cytochrome b561